MIKVDSNMTLHALVEAVEGRGPDYVYERQDGIDNPGCSNVETLSDGTHVASCIVGVVLADLIGSIEDIPREGASNSTLYMLEREGIIAFDETSKVMLAVAQKLQDEGSAWGVALDAASAVRSALYGKKII